MKKFGKSIFQVVFLSGVERKRERKRDFVFKKRIGQDMELVR